jgi:predicted ATPase/DNA-binding SARP family transcriptional activator/ABC-type glycerol-3-phosphate transport system substrate-binding protein
MLELCLLGSPTCTLDGRTLADVLLRKDLALLYYLAVGGQLQPRTSLAVLLWGDQAEAAARASLRKALSTLRKQMGDHLLVARDVVGLVRMQCTVDLWEFEPLARAAIDAGDTAQLSIAADLYRGDFLAGFAVRGAVDFDRWVYNTQERLRGLAVQVLTTLAAQQAKTGRLPAAIAAQRRVLNLEPWREESHRELMLLLAASGQRSAALAQYEACVQTLTEELGVRPDAETTSLAERLREPQAWAAGSAQPAEIAPAVGEPPVVSTAPAPFPWRSSLPPELGPIAGRTAELEELAAMLVDQECRQVTLLGPGGIGKTRLALALAHRLGGSFSHVAMLSLANVTVAGEILPVIGRTFGLGPASDNVLAVFRAENPALLLVLDDFEHLLPEGVEVLEQLLGAAARLRCLVTSREALNTRWEWRYELAELALPAGAGAADPARYGAVQMFLQLARRARSRRGIEERELPEVMRICRLVGGMPLAIELAAAQTASLSCAAIADQVAQGLERLAADRRDLPGRQRSLAASFDASWAGLSPREQDVLARLAAIHGEFTLEAALAIAEATVVDLVRLVDHSLVRMNSSGRYSLHEVIKQMAGRKLAGMADEPPAVLARYCNYYVHWVDQDMRWLTTTTRPAQESAEILENHLQHLWYLWLNGTELPERSRIAAALLVVEQTYFGYFDAASVRWDTWAVFDTFVQNYVHAAPTHSGVVSVDTVWMPLVAGELADMTDEFAAEAAAMLPAAVDTCRIDERLLGLPFDIDLGLLYCRRDLLHKYGFNTAPATWEELEQMAAVIQAGERTAGRRNFWGYIWQGQKGEALTSVALEWQHSEGGGCIVEPDGCISIANPRAAAALARAARWVGNISPSNFSEYTVWETAMAWEGGDAAFVRLWSAYLMLRMQPDMGPTTVVTVLPRGSACHASTLGGRPLVVLRSFPQRAEAFALLKEICAPAAQRARLLRRDIRPPTIQGLYDDPAVLAIHPYLEDIHRLIETGGLAVRPAKVTGALYPQVSALYADTVTEILTGRAEAMPTLLALEQQLVALGGWQRS